MADYFRHLSQQHRKAVNKPFRTDEYMQGPPSCTRDSFKIPRLRQCPFDPASLRWKAGLGGGLDGYVWEVKFGEKGPFALKVFWDTQPLSYEDMDYWPLQRECHNAALLQMMEESVSQSTKESPILVKAHPTTRDDAWANQVAFSQDGRLRQQHRFQRAPAVETKVISRTPRLRKCHGWMGVSSEVLDTCPFDLMAPSIVVDGLKRTISSEENYVAIVYEYVEEGGNDHDVVDGVLDFLWLAGFSLTKTPLEKNWTSGVLLDLSDIIPPRAFGWEDQWYQKRDVSRVLRN